MNEFVTRERDRGETWLEDINIRARYVIIVITVLPGGGRRRLSVCTSFCNLELRRNMRTSLSLLAGKLITLYEYDSPRALLFSHSHS